MPKAIVTSKHHNHRNDRQIGLYFDYTTDLIKTVKGPEGMRWSQRNRYWYIKNTPDNLRKIDAAYKGKSWIESGIFFNQPNSIEQKRSQLIGGTERNFTKIPPEYTDLLIRRRYSEHTIKTYQHYFSDFINHFPGLQIDELTEDHVGKFQDHLVNKKKVALRTQHQDMNAIRFYYEHVPGGEQKTFYIERPGKERKLPNVLREQQIRNIIQALDNLKHRTKV